jgi:hypothetical protein
MTVPERRETMYAVYAPLCQLAGVDPDHPYRWRVEYLVEGEEGLEYQEVAWKEPRPHKNSLECGYRWRSQFRRPQALGDGAEKAPAAGRVAAVSGRENVAVSG